jgi:osmoprotectant transport system permease protein
MMFLASLVLLAVTLAALPHMARPLAHLFPGTQPAIYPFASFASLLARQAILVALAAGTATLLGAGLAIAVTRGGGRAFRPLAAAVASAGQTFPPVAVLALSVPLFGYGMRPAFVALALYALLPVLSNTLAGLDAVPPAVREAADGMGLSPMQRLRRVELPLALPLILAGVRTATIVSIGTAAIASTVGVPTLGSPILDGLVSEKTGYVVEGALVAALFAVATDLGFERLARLTDPFSRARLRDMTGS